MTMRNNQSPQIQSRHDQDNCQQENKNFFNELVLSQLNRAALTHYRNLELLKSMGYTTKPDIAGNSKSSEV